jgi:hypothetical protein
MRTLKIAKYAKVIEDDGTKLVTEVETNEADRKEIAATPDDESVGSNELEIDDFIIIT